MKHIKISLTVLFFSLSLASYAQPLIQNKKWRLIWEDNFNTNDNLDAKWDFQNSPSRTLECSRWRENASVENGVLNLENKKENRGGQKFTSASMWTKSKFQYGYFECRYRYAEARGTNNSFWLMPKNDSSKFEIDINEGHYPNEIATNTHRSIPLPKFAASRCYRAGADVKPQIKIELKKPVLTNKVRLISLDPYHVSIAELNIYSGKVNVALKGKAQGNSTLRAGFESSNAIDGKLGTHWASAEAPPDTLVITLDKPYRVDSLQIHSGYYAGDSRNVLYDYTIQSLVNDKWVNLSTGRYNKAIDLSKEFHTYGLLWNQKELIWYFDGKEIRRELNTFCNGEANIWLSSAIAGWAGPVSDKIDGTAMKVDYVRVYEPVNE